MKVIFDEYFYRVYSSDPASAPGRIEAIADALPSHAEIVQPEEAPEEQIRLAHTDAHIRTIKNQGLYDISALAAGGAILSARTGLKEPAFGLIRPPGHHASADSAWGFCFFNNMAIALLALKQEKLIETALVLDIDLHFGDGTVNILGGLDWVRIYNPAKNSREKYMEEVEGILLENRSDIIGISAGFDNHMQDWGGLLATTDYYHIGLMAKQAAAKAGGGCFAILEGGYNHSVLGKNASSLINGMAEPVD
ncbi:MAG: histone deacetylase family protein [Desulfobacteraceae bacterium]|nr:histone deacetylase family protein [Desulfobacteraceae bacterium]